MNNKITEEVLKKYFWHDEDDNSIYNHDYFKEAIAETQKKTAEEIFKDLDTYSEIEMSKFSYWIDKDRIKWLKQKYGLEEKE